MVFLAIICQSIVGFTGYNFRDDPGAVISLVANAFDVRRGNASADDTPIGRHPYRR